MQLSESLKPFQKAAEQILQKGLVGDIEFSGTTYQVQIHDKETGDEVWAFLQLDGRGQIKDCFCSCEEGEGLAACAHLAAAFLRIYNGNPTPLHQRFQRSLWNQLCQLYADRMGHDPQMLKPSSKGVYACTSVGGKTVFSIKGKTPQATAHLKELILQRHRETEETSLKFSNLSQEELMRWREGKPSPHLQYELSFWNDIAKWLMMLQENGEKGQISFGYSEKNIPNQIFAAFEELHITFYLSEANLPSIIPSLVTVDSPLAVHNAPQEAIRRIIYDKKAGALLIEAKEIAEKSKRKKSVPEKQGIRLNGWIFIYGDGFYATDPHELLKTPILTGRQISQALNQHFHVIKDLIEGTFLHEDSIPVSYAIAFDQNWNLHLSCYLFSPGDLTLGESRYFGDWAYLDDDGFYHLDGLVFHELEIVIPADGVADFVRQNRTWLNTQEGFHTHLASVEAQMTYTLSEDHYLSFHRILNVQEAERESKDFGAWVYIAGQGFYSKVSSHIGLPLRPGIALGPDQIPLFIRMNREELQLIPGFFSQKCPVLKSGLHIHLTEEETVEISPEYELDPEYRDAKLLFFEDFVYVEGEGFHELPSDTRLPERYRHPLVVEPNNLDLFLNYELESLKQYASKIDPRLLKPSHLSLVAASIAEDTQKGKGWYALKLKYHADAGEVLVSALSNAVARKKRFCFTPVGLFDLEDKRYNWLMLIDKSQIDRRSNILHLSTLELIRLNAFEEIEVKKGKGEEYAHSKEILKELTEFRIPQEPNLKGLNSHLRPYQMLGVNWLWFLYEHGLSGLLCDDMGLGKTHQTMALFAAVLNHLKEKGDKDPRHFLVICPTSVIYHWQEKLESFLPGVRVCTFHGSNRSMQDFRQQYDVLLTSYGIWRIEAELLNQVPFEVAIFDEIQVAKNHNSRIYSSLLTVQAKMRLGLTGTPIENHLRELKSLFDIVLPHYMIGEADYREFFVKPIEKEGNQERKKLLSRVIKPFVMRRKKEDVLLDLPEKIEEISHCELAPSQQHLYQEVLIKSREQILKELSDNEAPIPYIHIFAILSSLKQVCNHPAVYFKTPEKYKEYDSGKWDLFTELLSEARDSRQKVVVFSQYLNMLDIIEDYLGEQGIGFATIRGSTLNRGEQIQRFNQDPNCEVFVASLQAAGLGVDLTAASVVIHYDRWWNAARENQATDRVHRIGQKRGVQVFKLVTKGTFEERIDALIFKKGKLMEEVVGIDDHQVVKHFSREEIKQLLQLVDQK